MGNEHSSPKHSIQGRWSDSVDMHKSPGPGQYPNASPSATQKQVLSTQTSAPHIQIGTSRRKPLLAEGADIDVGPGEYADSPIGSYKYKKDPKFSFSVAGRKRAAVGDKTALRENKTGPNRRVGSSMGYQRDSTRRSG